MDFAPVYLIQRFFYRLVDFFHHWYVDGSRVIGHRFISALEKTDQSLAIKITIRYFFQPLYKDYTVIGRILGVIFRSGRIAIGAVVYLVIVALFALFYLAWLATPAIIIFYAARGL
jgi:hypothetical protein